ncbi:extracellular solute-binding protein [Cellulomonas fimi]|uniref:ABC transporter substrate-binding protein n=1 Tax=Cellulomonas fimi TaxID=1708 RepID=UPI002892DE67|nr:extracellular solute-binding protein [Cellulomonas fimi]
MTVTHRAQDGPVPPLGRTTGRRRRRLLLTSVVALSTALVAACAQGSGGGDAAEDVSFGSDTELSGNLSVMGFGAGDEIAQVRMEAAQKALGDGVDVSLIEGDLDIQAFLSAVAADDPPELISANRDQIGTFASRGAIIPLDDCLDAEGVDTSVFQEAALAQVTFNDQVYGIPEFNQVQLTQANGDLLAAAGLTIEDVNGSSWERIAAANQALAKSEGGKVSVIGYDSKLPEFLPLWAKANGADLLSQDGRTAQLDDPAVVEALEFAVGIYDAQGGFPAVKAFRDSADFFGENNQFATSTLGAMPMEQWYINVVNDVSPDAPVVYDSFRGRDGEPLAFSSGSAWAIPKGSANPQAACTFAATMVATDSWMAAAQARADIRAEEGKPFTMSPTANTEADEQIRAMVDLDEPKFGPGLEAMYAGLEKTFTLPANPADAEFKTAWQDGVNRVLNGQQEPAEALAQAQEEAQAALDEAWADWDARG